MRRVPKSKFTTVIGVDGNYIKQLETVIPNWRVFRPEILSNPTVIFFDPLTMEAPNHLVYLLGDHVRLVAWKPKGEFQNQRHKMLSGHIAIPAREVKTDHWIKIDCDCYAEKQSKWLERDWFGRKMKDKVIICQRWGYTKPANQMEVLDNWGDTVPELAQYPRLNLPYDPESNKVRHSRFISRVMVGRADFARWAYSLYDGDVCPVASQDGYHYYVLARSGKEWAKANMKRKGWKSMSRLSSLQREVGLVTPEIGDINEIIKQERVARISRKS